MNNLEKLRNGATVLESKDDIVLAYWPGTSMPWAVWRRDACDPASVHSGSYFQTLPEAVFKYQERTLNTVCQHCGYDELEPVEECWQDSFEPREIRSCPKCKKYSVYSYRLTSVQAATEVE